MHVLLCVPVVAVTIMGFQNVTFTTEDGARIEAAFFDGGQGRAVVFAHGAVFDRESWYPLAERLKK